MIRWKKREIVHCSELCIKHRHFSYSNSHPDAAMNGREYNNSPGQHRCKYTELVLNLPESRTR